MINSYIRSLKFLNYLILTIPSNPILLVASSQQRYNSAKIVFQINCQVSTSAGRFQKAQKLNGKVRNKLIKTNTSYKNIQKTKKDRGLGG